MNLLQKALKYTFFEPITFVNRVDRLSDFSYFLIFVLTVDVFQIHLIIYLLDFSLC